MGFVNVYQSLYEYFESYFTNWIQKRYAENFGVNPGCRYVLNAPGKRIRPISMLLVARVFNRPLIYTIPAAIAIELCHNYSLVHDDLPAMDDDDWRHHQPSAHSHYSEAEAILIGDALLTDTFELLSDPGNSFDLFFPPDQRIRSIHILSAALGSRGMVLGQKMDIRRTNTLCQESGLENLHRQKTGKLLGAAFAIGALLNHQEKTIIDTFQEAGEHLGVAFQFIDDLLDQQDDNQINSIEGSARDNFNEFSNFHTEKTKQLLNFCNLPSKLLHDFASWLLQRTY